MSRQPCILIVEDFADARELFKGIARAEGFDVHGGVTGEDAVRLAAEHRPDVILMDLMLPVMDGFEAARQIRAAQGANRPAIIGVTALSPEACRQALSAGCDECFRKPLEGDLLHRLLRWFHLGIESVSATRPKALGGSASE